MFSQRILALAAVAVAVCAPHTAQAVDRTGFVELKAQDCLSKAPTDQICLFENEDYKGNCACVGMSTEYGDMAIKNSPGAKSVWFPKGSDLVMNVFTDDYVRKSKSLDSSAPKHAAAKFVVGKRNTVCLFDDTTFHGDKVCLPADGKPFKHPRGFLSVMFFPNTGSGVQADIKGQQSLSATLMDPITKPLYEVTVSSSKQKSLRSVSFDDMS